MKSLQESKNNTESEATPKITFETQGREISSEEFLNIIELEEQKFKQETIQETTNLNSIGVSQPIFEKTKIEANIEKDLTQVNNEAKEIVGNTKKEVLNEKEVQNSKDIFILSKAEMNQITIRPDDRNAEGKLLVSPNGPESELSEENWKIVRTPSFKSWFGDWQKEGSAHSDVINENGEPALVYHTTNVDMEDFDSFSDEKNEERKKLKKHGKTGHYFTSSENYEYGKNRLSVFINAKLKNVDRITDIVDIKDKKRAVLEKKGYNGMVYTFYDKEKELMEMKKEYRRNFTPKSISDKIFYGFNKLASKLGSITGIENPNSRLQHNFGKEWNLKYIRNEMRHLNETKRSIKSPFFEVAVFESDQVMIVTKEENYKSKI